MLHLLKNVPIIFSEDQSFSVCTSGLNWKEKVDFNICAHIISVSATFFSVNPLYSLFITAHNTLCTACHFSHICKLKFQLDDLCVFVCVQCIHFKYLERSKFSNKKKRVLSDWLPSGQALFLFRMLTETKRHICETKRVLRDKVVGAFCFVVFNSFISLQIQYNNTQNDVFQFSHRFPHFRPHPICVLMCVFFLPIFHISFMNRPIHISCCICVGFGYFFVLHLFSF